MISPPRRKFAGVITATRGWALHQNVAAIYPPSISRIESVTLKIGKRAVANGRSGTRELPRTQNDPSTLRTSGGTSDDTPLLGPFRDILRTSPFRSCDGKKSELSSFSSSLRRRSPSPCHSTIWSPFRALRLHRQVPAASYNPCVRVCFIFIYRRPDFIPLRWGRRREIKWSLRGRGGRNPARWQVIITKKYQPLLVSFAATRRCRWISSWAGG